MTKKDRKEQTQVMQQLVEQQTWIRSPWKFTHLGKRRNLLQQQVLSLVSNHLQGYIRNFYDMHLDKSPVTPKPLFTQQALAEGLQPIRIYLQDLGITPNHYEEAREMVESMIRDSQVEHQEYDENGMPTGRTRKTNVFSYAGFEATGEYRHYTKNNERQLTQIRQSYIDLKINPDVQMWAFDMAHGYVTHLKQIAMYSTKASTPRIYLMLLRRLGKTQQQCDARIPTQELREYLGMTPYRNKEGKMVSPYPMFSNFRQKVLDPVMQDLQRMAAEFPSQTDITFTYDLQYPSSRHKGDPEAIIFHIERTSLGMAYNVVVNHAKMPVEQNLFATAIEQQPYIDIFRKALRHIRSCVTKDNAERFAKVRFVEYKDGGLYLELPDEDTYKWIESDEVVGFFHSGMKKYFSDIKDILYRVAG